tara:strand:- start:14729 stop:15568 length:840 start_codon:yes stop_codon:yes gene_type:complete
MKVLQLVLVTGLCKSLSADAQVYRAPANYVPDDDMIVVPMVIERNKLDEFNERHEDKFKSAKKQLKQWIYDQEYVEAYGLEGTGAVRLPTPEEKQRFFERNYLRFLTKDVENANNEFLTNQIDELTADEELATIETFEAREEYIVEAKKEATGSESAVKELKSEVKVGKEKFKFNIQPRVEMGMVKITFKSSYFRARAWVGINGNQEFKLYRTFSSTGTRAQVNYFYEQRRVLASIDQPLIPNWSLRLTHDRQEAAPELNALEEDRENNVIQIRFGKRF